MSNLNGVPTATYATQLTEGDAGQARSAAASYLATYRQYRHNPQDSATATVWNDLLNNGNERLGLGDGLGLSAQLLDVLARHSAGWAHIKVLIARQGRRPVRHVLAAPRAVRRAVVHRVFPPPPPPGTAHYVSPSGHVHYYSKATGRVMFVQPPPPPGVEFIGPRPPTRVHALYVAPPSLPRPPTAMVHVRYVAAPAPTPCLVHYVMPSGAVHYMNPATQKVVYVQPPPPPGIKFVGPPPPTVQAATIVVPPGALPPPPAAVLAPPAPPVVVSTAPGAVVDQGSDLIRQRALELANGILLNNQDAYASAGRLSGQAQGGDWMSKQVLEAAHATLLNDGAPGNMVHAVDWANQNPNDLDAPDAQGSGGNDPYGSISGELSSSVPANVAKELRAIVRGANLGDQNATAMLAQLRKDARRSPVVRRNLAYATQYARSIPESSPGTNVGSQFGSDDGDDRTRGGRGMDGVADFGSCGSPCYNCVQIGSDAGTDNGVDTFGSCASPCYNCVKIGTDGRSRGGRGADGVSDFGSCGSPCYNCVKIGADGGQPCEQCAGIGGELEGNVGALASRFGDDLQPSALEIGCPCTGPGFGDDSTPSPALVPAAPLANEFGGCFGGDTFGAARHHAAKAHHMAKVHHAHKHAAKKHAAHHAHHPAFANYAAPGNGGGGAPSANDPSGGGGRVPPLRQLWLAASQGNRKALQRIAGIQNKAVRGDLRAQSALKALEAFSAAAGPAGNKMGRAVKLSHGRPLTTAAVHGIGAEFGADSVHFLRGVRAPMAALPASTSAAVRQAMAAGQIVGQAQALQAMRFPGAPLPGGVMWETGT